MLRTKQQRILIAFNTTTDAFKMEKYADQANSLGRLIPVPPEIKAGCGLAFSAPIEEKNLLAEVISNNNISIDIIKELYI